LQRLEWISLDQRMKTVRGDVRAPNDIALILINEASLQTLNPLLGRYPWPRSVYADMLDFLSRGHPRAVVFDILFTENEKDAPGAAALSVHDRRLIDTTRRTGFTYHAAQINNDPGVDGRGNPLPADFISRFRVPGTTGFAAAGNNSYTLPINGLYQAARGVGMVGMAPDGDGVYRRVKLFQVYQGNVYPALSVAPLFAVPTPGGVRVNGDRLWFAHRRVPLDGDGNYLINPYPAFNAYSIANVFASLQKMRGGDVENMIVRPDEFKDKIVFVGANALGLEDLKATPLSSATPGVYLHAAAAANLLTGDFLTVASPWLTAVLIATLALATGTGIALVHRFAL
jgi:adenylate cyclase